MPGADLSADDRSLKGGAEAPDSIWVLPDGRETHYHRGHRERRANGSSEAPVIHGKRIRLQRAHFETEIASRISEDCANKKSAERSALERRIYGLKNSTTYRIVKTSLNRHLADGLFVAGAGMMCGKFGAGAR